MVQTPRVEDVIAEEQQNYQLNGIIVESKLDNTEQERTRIKQMYLMNHPLLNPPFWVPNTITEFLFYDDRGIMQTNEATCKALYTEFTNIMQTIYSDYAKRYNECIKNII